ncbi:hypothetical protein MAFF212519_05510 [Clavibacter michiganensis]
MGGSGEGTNPEQLFAAGYSACFLGATHLVGKNAGVDTKDAGVSASVSIGDNGQGGFGLAVELDVYLPNVRPSAARRSRTRPTRSARTPTPRAATST